jgi:hypothetical protein
MSQIMKLRHRCALSLTVAQILAWADNHHACTGTWPGPRSGRISGAAGETWSAVNRALRFGERGLHGGTGLYALLRQQGRFAERRGRPAQPNRGFLASILRIRGHSLTEIGRLLGVSRQRAFQLVRTEPSFF